MAISTRLRDALDAFETAIRAHQHLGDRDGKAEERAIRVQRARGRIIAVIEHEDLYGSARRAS